jgi:hypothetical protein
MVGRNAGFGSMASSLPSPSSIMSVLGIDEDMMLKGDGT